MKMMREENRYCITLSTPAGSWQQGFLLGNGFMGQVLYGQPFQETIELSEITFFSGSDTQEVYQDKAPEAFEEMRRAASAQKWEEVAMLTEQYMGKRGNYGTNLPVGKLLLSFPIEEAGGYTRQLNLEEGVARVSFTKQQGAVKVQREAFTSHEDRVFAMLLEEDADQGMSFQIHFDGGKIPFHTICYQDALGFCGQALEDIHSDGTEGVSLVGMIRVVTLDGSVKVSEDKILVENASKAVLYVAMDTDYSLTPGEKKNLNKDNIYHWVNHSFEDYKRIKERHIQDISVKMKRQKLVLGRPITEEETIQSNISSEASLIEPCEKLSMESATEPRKAPSTEPIIAPSAPTLTSFGAKMSTTASNTAQELLEKLPAGDAGLYLTELMFQYGRYLLLSSSREDSLLPAPLQGVWNDNVACRIGWTCDMHLDINTQMNYWISEAGNLPECHHPVFRWMEQRLLPNGRKTAQQCYGRPGWTAELVSNAWGYSAPYWNKGLSPCPTGGIWQASDYMEHYRYGQELDFLRERAFPVIQEAVLFFLDYLFEENGFLTSGPSISPENAFLVNGEKYYASNGCTYEILMIRELFSEFLEAYYQLGEDPKQESLAKQVQAAMEKLPPYRILPDKTLAEWSHNYPSADPQHRHTSHLLGLFPYGQITPWSTPELAEAAQRTIEAKLTPLERWEDTGWARSMLMLYSARLGKGEQAYFHLKSMQEHLTGPNLLVMHPPTRGAGSFMEVYELDGNTGFSMTVLEMLIQSHNSVIRLLPAIPKAWKDGKVEGVLVRRGVSVDMEWCDSVPVTVTLTAKRTGDYYISYVDQTRKISLEAGKTLQLRRPFSKKHNIH